MELVFYNKSGEPIAYCEDGEYIFSFDGVALAYFAEDSIYNYDGKHLGRFSNGWVRDNDGYCAFFTDNASGGPSKPFKKFIPFKAFKDFKPFKSFKEFKPFRPFDSNSWSSKSNIDYFK
jgi:hypothetical protein